MDLKNIIGEFAENNPTNGLEILAQLFIDGSNTAFPNSDSDKNFQRIKSCLEDNELKPMTKTSILETISAKTKIVDRLYINSSIPEILSWFFRQKSAESTLPMLDFTSYYLCSKQMAAVLAGMEEAYISLLNLNSNNIGSSTPEELTKFFVGLKKLQIISLRLNGNNLQKLTPAKWVALFAALSGIASLDLTGNNLDHSTKEQWNAICEGISLCGITKLNILKDNNLNPDQIKQLQEIIQNNVRKLGLAEGNGLKNLCAFSFWKSPGAKIETSKNSNNSEMYRCTFERISEPQDIAEDIGKFLLRSGEELKTFGLY